MKLLNLNTRAPLLAALLGLTALLSGCERPPADSVQSGFRGTGMVQVYNPRTVDKLVPLNQPPEAIAPGAPEGPKAKDVLQNVKVLGDLSIGQFTAQMAAITAWVSPQEGCGYCHNLANLADDSKYTKVVARRMLQMTQQVNTNWKPHVAATGVTCYTCHRGKPVPEQVWFAPEPQNKQANFIGNTNGQNKPSKLGGPGFAALRPVHALPAWKPTRASALAAPLRCPPATPRRSRPPKARMR